MCHLVGNTSHQQCTFNWIQTTQQGHHLLLVSDCCSLLALFQVLINNAGIYGRRAALADFTPEDFSSVFQTNTIGPFMVVQQLLQQELLGPPGSLIVNITSIMSSHGDQTVSSVTPGGYAYRASKAALNIINKALSLDLKDRQVECVLVHPGYVKTDMTGGRGNEPKGW